MEPNYLTVISALLDGYVPNGAMWWSVDEDGEPKQPVRPIRGAEHVALAEVQAYEHLQTEVMTALFEARANHRTVDQQIIDEFDLDPETAQRLGLRDGRTEEVRAKHRAYYNNKKEN